MSAFDGTPAAEASMFSLFTPTAGAPDEPANGNFANMTPKLNAQTLFAFGVSSPQNNTLQAQADVRMLSGLCQLLYFAIYFGPLC